MYFHNKLIWSHKYEYCLLDTWSKVKHPNWHATHNYILLWTEVVLEELVLLRLRWRKCEKFVNKFRTYYNQSKLYFLMAYIYMHGTLILLYCPLPCTLYWIYMEHLFIKLAWEGGVGQLSWKCHLWMTLVQFCMSLNIDMEVISLWSL